MKIDKSFSKIHLYNFYFIFRIANLGHVFYCGQLDFYFLNYRRNLTVKGNLDTWLSSIRPNENELDKESPFIIATFINNGPCIKLEGF